MKKSGIKKYRRKNSLRKPGWDYRNDGAYFITICTKNRGRFFGLFRWLLDRTNLLWRGRLIWWDIDLDGKESFMTVSSEMEYHFLE